MLDARLRTLCDLILRIGREGQPEQIGTRRGEHHGTDQPIRIFELDEKWLSPSPYPGPVGVTQALLLVLEQEGTKRHLDRSRALTGEQREALATRPYALGLDHKHVPEMRHYSCTAQAPLFTPSVGTFYKGMLTQIPVFLTDLAPGTTLESLHTALTEAYRTTRFVNVLPLGAEGVLEAGYLSPTDCNDTNDLEIMVFGNDVQAVLIARYDNLGKGAAGSAVQNLNLMLGLDESTGL